MAGKKLFVLLFALLTFTGSQASAEAWEFVDAQNTTGYYVDADSVNFKGENIVEANIAVVKANTNRMFIYYMQFDRGLRTYQIGASRVIKYDTKEEIDSKDAVQQPRQYSPTSPMNEIVEYIFDNH